MDKASDCNRVFITGGKHERSFSGCSYYFTQSLSKHIETGSLVEIPFCFYSEMRLELIKWSLRMKVDPRPYFYMTQEYQEYNLSKVCSRILSTDTYISFSPILPQTVLNSSCKVLLMIDMTLEQYLGYEHFGSVPQRITEEIRRCEKQSYDRADRIFAASAVTREQMTALYDVPGEKIEVIGRGVNMPANASLSRKDEKRGTERLRIGFVGHDFRRKGLPILIQAVETCSKLIGSVFIECIGPTANDIQARSWVKLHGYVDKGISLEKYINILGNCDIGYLFSQSEGIPGSVLEFLCLGVPCLISDIPQMESIRDLPGILQVPLLSGAAGVANELLSLLSSQDKLAALKRGAAMNRFQGWNDQAERVLSWCN